MPAGTVQKIRSVLILLALAVLALGVLKALDDPRTPWEGFLRDNEWRVMAIMQGGPADAAGMMAGDAIVSVDGVSTTDTRALAHLERATIGAPRIYEIQRGSEHLRLRLTPGPISSPELFADRIQSALGGLFVLLPLWAFLTVPSAATLILTVFGLCWGKAMLGSPWLASAGLRNLMQSIDTAAVVLGFAALLHFLLIFPDRRPFMERREAGALVYWPAIIVAIAMLLFNIIQPVRSSEMATAFRLTFDLLTIGYFMATLATLFRRHSSASVEARARHGLNLMMAGAVLGVFPLLLAALVRIFSPLTFLPFSEYYPLALGLIPITFSLAAVHSARD